MTPRQNQGILEARIRDLERRIESAQIVESIETDKVGIGTRVKLRDLDYDEEMEYALVDDHSRSLGGDVEIVSPESPIGQALMNRLAGETVEVPVPAGILRLEILDIQTA